MFKVSIFLVLGGIIAEIWLMATNEGRSRVMELTGMIDLGEEAQIAILLGSDFLNMAAIFLVVLTIVVLAVCTYVNRVLTKPPRIFY